MENNVSTKLIEQIIPQESRTVLSRKKKKESEFFKSFPRVDKLLKINKTKDMTDMAYLCLLIHSFSFFFLRIDEI